MANVTSRAPESEKSETKMNSKYSVEVGKKLRQRGVGCEFATVPRTGVKEAKGGEQQHKERRSV